MDTIAPTDIALEVIAIYYPLQLRLNRLGDYGGAFSDKRVKRVLEAFQGRLREIDALIEARNAGRLLPYGYSMPSLIPNSIHV